MKKLFLLATAALLVSGVSFANTDKGKRKNVQKGNLAVRNQNLAVKTLKKLLK